MIRWTPEMDAAVLDLSTGNDPTPYEIAAERIGVCKKSLIERQQTLGVFRYRGRGKKPLNWTEPMVTEVRAQWPNSGVTIGVIARRLRISSSAVAKKARELGLGPKPTELRSPEEHERLIFNYIRRNPGCSSSDIIKELRLDRTTVYRTLRQLRASNRCRRRDKPTYFANT